MKLFEFDIHIGDWRTLIQSRDIQNGAVQGRHITNNAVTGDKIGDGEIKSVHIAPEAVTGDKIGDGEIKSINIGKGVIQSKHIAERSITGDSMEPDALPNGKLANNAVSERNMQPGSVGSRAIKPKSVTSDKLGDDVQSSIVFPVTNTLDEKYANITNELYDMVRSLQVGGVALSSQFGDRTDIGITQKSLTIAFGKILDILGDILGKDFMDYKFSVNPTTAYAEGEVIVTVIADSSLAIGNFDSIKIYVNDELKAESSNITRYVAPISISESAEIKCVGVIMGKTIIKRASVFKETPFFMGSGMDYQDAMVPENHKELVGTLEGDYDTTVGNDGEHIFIIIPISRKDEFRRADMNDVEIPFETPVEMNDFVVYKSLNVYQAGTYNIDININS